MWHPGSDVEFVENKPGSCIMSSGFKVVWVIGLEPFGSLEIEDGLLCEITRFPIQMLHNLAPFSTYAYSVWGLFYAMDHHIPGK